MYTLTSLFSEYLTCSNSIGLAALYFFAMAVGHVVADYPLQGEYLARTKDPAGRNEAIGEGKHDWILSLNAHCLIHAGTVWLITGIVWFGIIEWVLHLIVDYLKIRNVTNLWVDQILHFLCKLIYAIVLGYALV